VLLRLSWAELKAGRKRLWAPGLAFAFSLAALSFLLVLEQKIQSSLENQGREMLGADLKLESPRLIREDEKQSLLSALPKDSETQSYTEFNTMLASGNLSRLSRLHAVQNEFPFYGKLEFDGHQINDLDPKQNQILVSKELADYLAVAKGSEVVVGGKKFLVVGVLKNAPPSVTSFFQLSPPAWIHFDRLQATGLIDRPGRIEHSVLVKAAIPDLGEFITSLRKTLDDPMLRIDRYDQADRGFQGLYQQIRFFAQFVTVLALLLSGFSVLGALQNWLYERRLLIASLRIFGASSRQIMVWTLQSTLIFAFVFAALGVAGGRILNVWLSPTLEQILPFRFSWEPSFIFDFGVFIFGVLTLLIFSLTAQSGAAHFRPLLLLRADAETHQEAKPRLWGAIFGGIALLLLFFGLSFFVLQSVTKAFQLTFGALGLVVFAFGLANFLLWLLAKFKDQKSFYLFYSVRALTRQRRSTVLSAATLFCVSALLSIIIFIQEGLKGDFQVEEGVAQASVFAFDLGEKEKKAVDEVLENDPKVEVNWAPWVRVKWLKKNGEGVEVQSSERLFDPTEMNIGIAEKLPDSNHVISGDFWSGKWNGTDLPALSVTRDFARQADLKIGDELKLDLWGVPFDVRVSNFRSVRWTEFHPSFRILIQEGFLTDLPLSYVASFSTKDPDSRVALLGEFSKRLPAVSVIDLTKVKKDLVELTNKLTLVLVAILFFLMGLAFVLMMALAGEKTLRRQNEFAQLKVLGANGAQLRKLILWEYALVTSLPLFVGMGVGIFLGGIVLNYFFNIESSQAWSFWLLVPPALGILMTLGAAYGSRQLVRVRPLQLFGS